MNKAGALLTSLAVSQGFATRASMATSGLINRTFDRLRRDPDEILVLDGGTGEELFAQGVPDDRKIWSATAVVKPEYHETLKRVHQSFIESGSEAITTNSYGIVPGVGFSLPEIKKHVATSGRIALDAANESANKSGRTRALVLGSLGPLVESYRPDLIMRHDEGVAFYAAIAEALCPYVDCFLAETISSYDECTQAVEAVGSLSGDCSRSMMVSFTLNGKGLFRDGEAANDGIRRLIAFLVVVRLVISAGSHVQLCRT